ncbi:PTS lactose/cellobiose transporter subunit IIA [Lactococcus garvieae]|nr:PTS lactose/cellobiose transporter subunit IIA [Lactococcus garvieae]
MNEERMEIVMGIIMYGGNAKGLAFQAIQQAKEGDFEAAEKSLQESNQELLQAHDVQTDMLTKEAQGIHTEIDLYMVHAQDHLMNAITFKDLATEIISQEKRIQALEKAAN